MNNQKGAALNAFVNRLTLRSILTDKEEAAILNLNGQLKNIDHHNDFVGQGELVNHSCLIVNGLAGRFGQRSDGARQITCLHIPGDMADLPSVVSPKSAWGLSALSKATILRIPHADLRRIAAQYPGIAEAFWRDCVADGSIFSEWVVNVGRRDAITRLAHVYCEMGVRYECAGLGDRRSFPLQITQSDLGDATGLTPVHINRTLQEMRSRSLVIANGKTVTVPDWDLLVAAADFDEDFLLLGGPSPRIVEAA